MFAILPHMLALAILDTQFVSAVPALVTVVNPFLSAGPSPLTADILGVDAQGRTTYALHQVEIVGTSTTIPLTATLVPGSDHIFYDLVAPGLSLNFDCDLLGDGNAVCSDIDESGRLETATVSAVKSLSLVLDVIETSMSGGSGPSQTAPAQSGGAANSIPAPGGSAPTFHTSATPNLGHRFSGSAFAVFICILSVYQLL